jgi:tetratricopeptide (TPR) repeat protein
VKTILAILLTFLLFLPVSALGEIQTITHTVKQPFGGSQSADDARISALAKAKREALEMAGVYVEALTIVKDATVDKDEILALAAGVLKTEVVSQENYHTKDAFGIDVVVRVVVDTSVLEGRVKKLLQDRTHLEQLNQASKKEKILLDKMARLEEQNRRLMVEKGSSKDLKNQFKEVSQELTAARWLYQAVILWDWDRGNFTDPGKAIEYLNNAITLLPDLADAYNYRGNAYSALGQYQRAIEDYNESIHLQPDFAQTYYNRGHVYATLGQDQRAIADYNKAIRLKPDFTDAYKNRGIVYAKLARYDDAIEDYRQAVRINPKDAITWHNIAIVYAASGNRTAALEAVRELRRLDPAMADDLFNLIMPR